MTEPKGGDVSSQSDSATRSVTAKVKRILELAEAREPAFIEALVEGLKANDVARKTLQRAASDAEVTRSDKPDPGKDAWACNLSYW